MSLNSISSINGNQPTISKAIDTASSSPQSSTVQNFNTSLGQGNSATQEANGSKQPMGDKDLLNSVLQLVKLLLDMMLKQDSSSNQSPSKTSGGSTPASGGNGIKSVEGSGPGGSAGSNELIPPPTENIQSFDLGNKKVTIGSDGSSSANEVANTASTIKDLYNNSSTFRNMIDSSSDPSFDVTVGKRGDNTSWGNTTGKVFMNTNNIAPGNSDDFQSLLGHEFAHASIDLGHGSDMTNIEQAVAQEA